MANWFICAGKFLEAHNGVVTAIATVFIAIFTIVLAYVTRTQARLTRDAIKLARDEFNATHRPKLRVRNILVKYPTEVHAARFKYFDPSMPVAGQLYVDNIGDAPATLVHSHCIVFWKQGELPMKAPYEGNSGNEFLGHPSLVPGASATGVFQSEDTPGQLAHSIALGNQQARIWIMGWVEYADANGFIRQMRFCRLWHPDLERFIVIENRDYDYED